MQRKKTAGKVFTDEACWGRYLRESCCHNILGLRGLTWRLSDAGEGNPDLEGLQARFSATITFSAGKDGIPDNFLLQLVRARHAYHV